MLEVPELKLRDPLTPDMPALAVRTTTLPLDEALPYYALSIRITESTLGEDAPEEEP